MQRQGHTLYGFGGWNHRNLKELINGSFRIVLLAKVVISDSNRETLKVSLFTVNVWQNSKRDFILFQNHTQLHSSQCWP